MNGSRTARPSSPRTFFPLLILSALLLALVAAAPALAYEDWEHGGASESTCDSSGCHATGRPSNTACLASGCHAAFTTSGRGVAAGIVTRRATPAAWQTAGLAPLPPNGDEPSYPPLHARCDSPSRCRRATARPAPPATACRLGSAAAPTTTPPPATSRRAPSATTARSPVPPASHNDGKHTNCSTCHVGMNKATTDCAACHVGNPRSGGPPDRLHERPRLRRRRLPRQGREPRRHADRGGGLHHLSHGALCDRSARAPSATPIRRPSITHRHGETPERLRRLSQRHDRGDPPEPRELRHTCATCHTGMNTATERLSRPATTQAPGRRACRSCTPTT